MKIGFFLFTALIIGVFTASAQQDTGFIQPHDSILLMNDDSIQPIEVVFDDVPEAMSNTASENPKLQFNGYIYTDDRVAYEQQWKLNRQEYRLDFKAEYKPWERAKFYAEVWLRAYKYPDVSYASDLSDKKKILNFDADLREAYFDVYGLFTKNLDIRVGRQRIAWGTADRFNPTDNLNPLDLEDIWDFGRHLGSNAIKFDYYAGTFTFTAVGIPWFTPSVLPGSDWMPAFMPDFSMPLIMYDSTTAPGIVIPVYITHGIFTDTVVLPQRDIKHYPSFGLKVKKGIANFDVSASFVYGRDPLPVITSTYTDFTIDTLFFLPELKAEATVDVHAELTYIPMKTVGVDFRGSAAGMGIWGEAALFLPEKTYMKRYLHYSIPMLAMEKDSVLTDSLVLDNKPYVKFILGLDYTFKYGFYINFQYLHGFANERGPKELNDYFLLGLEWTGLRDRLKIGFLNAGFQIGDFKDVKNNYAWFYMPEITYRPVDNAEFVIGAHILDGSSTTAFGKVRKNDELYLKFKYSF